MSTKPGQLHVLFREGLALVLRPALGDIRILEAGSCAEALSVLAHSPPMDLVLMDIQLPGMSGLDGISRVREQFPDVPVVALSSNDDKETVLRALDAGAMGYVPKTSSSSVLVGALRLILARGIYLPPSVFLGEPPSHRAAPQSQSPSQPTPAPAQPTAVTPRDLGLTPRQAQVLYLLLQGMPAKLICRELELSSTTVKVHTSAVLRALNVTSRTQAVIAAGKLGLRFPKDSTT